MEMKHGKRKVRSKSDFMNICIVRFGLKLFFEIPVSVGGIKFSAILPVSIMIYFEFSKLSVTDCYSLDVVWRLCVKQSEWFLVFISFFFYFFKCFCLSEHCCARECEENGGLGAA